MQRSRLSWLVVLIALSLPGAASAQLVGRIDGEFAVSARGAATYSIPIVVPPGTAGAQPRIALAYDSQAGAGAFGTGFGLSGLSSIARCPLDLARDGERRAVAFDLRDRLCLDGARLVLVAGLHGEAGAEYRTERDEFARVRALGAELAAFEVIGRDGVRRHYGTTPDSRIEAQGRAEARVWALARTEDRAGNAVRFTYLEDSSAGEFALARIDYTENAAAGLEPFASLRLVLEARPDATHQFAAGSRVSTTRRVARIETYLGEERVREYRLAYGSSPATGRSRLASITLCGLGGECLPPTRFTWSDAPAGFARASAWDLPRQLWRDEQQEGVLADVDGDGRIDVVHGGSASQDAETWLNDGGGFSVAPAWRLPDDLFGQTYGNPRALLADLNGDDLPEYVRAYRRSSGEIEIATHVNLGDGFAEQPSAAFALPSYLFDYAGNRSRQLGQLTDVDGDGLLDWVQAFEGANGEERRETRLNTGAGFAPIDPRWTLPARLWSYEGSEQRAEAALVDLNGDGLPDLIRATATQASGEQREVWLNTGAGFSGPVAAWRPPHVLWNYSQPGMLRQEGELADVNGDALPDLVIAFENAGGSLRRETWLNTGAGWLRDSSWDLPTHLWTYQNDKHRQTAQLADVNGDGLSDVVQAFENASGANRQVTWLNTGRGFPDAPDSSPGWAAPREVWSYYQSAPRTKATLADLDGDGAADFVRAYRASATSLETYLGGGRAPRLTAVTDGLGGRVEIEYGTLSDPAVHVAGARPAHPEASVRQARSVVRRAGVGASAGELRWSAHRYGELRAHRLLDIELGFAWHETLDEASGLATTAFHRQDWPLQGLVEREETALASAQGDALVQRARHSLEALEAPAGVFAVRAVASREERFELDGGVVSDLRTTREFDAFGNPTREDVDFGDGFSRSTRTGYRNDQARWQLGLAERIDVTARGPGEPDQVRSVAQVFDERGLLARRTVEPDRPSLRVETEWARDAFGNEIERTVRGPDFATRASATVYEGRGRFAQLQIDPLGHASVSTIEPRFGLPIAQLGPDPTVPETRFVYDALGRLIATTRPDGVTTSVTRAACDSRCPPGATLVARSAAPGAPSVTLYLDALERVRRRETDGFDGRAVRVDLELDARGLVVAETRPYFVGAGAHVSRFEHDALGRPTRALAPDGTETRWAYAAREVRMTDTLGRTTTERRGARGEVVESIDASGAPTRYAWDAFGNLVAIRDAVGNETRFAYDEAGRRVARIDPDLGAAGFAYDALGQLIAQLDARGNYMWLTYDALGRLVRREGDGPTSRWLWDLSEHGVGKLARVETADGSYAREERYDAFGRSRATTTRFGGNTFELSRTYDPHGRVASLHYPTGFAVAYGYTATGHLESVRGVADGIVHWRAEARAADGRVERERLGNDLVTDRIFDPRTGRIGEIATLGAGAPGVQALRYVWDPRGNLSERHDDVAAKHESFGYDTLGRLASATLAGSGTQEFRYDAIGNLTYKTGVGGYRYPAPGEPRPHAPLQVGDDPRPLVYDAKGNVVSDPTTERALFWSLRDQLLAIATAEGYEFLSYAPQGELISRLEIGAAAGASSLLTLQIGDVFEQTTNLLTRRVERRHLIHADGALVAVHVTRSVGAPETRYVHRDHLESVVAMTDGEGGVLERAAYDAFGSGDAPASVAPRGYTGHVSLRNARLVHMKGRIYDPRLGRFLSPDPVAPGVADGQALNRYAYVANNPLRFVDPSGFLLAQPPSGGSGLPGLGVPGWNLGVAAAGSFLSGSWGNVRFGATEAWNGVSWLTTFGSWIADGARSAAGAALAGVTWAWGVYNSFNVGILPDSRTPLGLLQSIVQGITQPDDVATLYHIGVGPDGKYLPPQKFEGKFERGNLFVNGQCLTVDQAAAKGAALAKGDSFFMLHAPTVNLASDTIESAILKVAPSELSRQLATILDNATGPVNLIGYSQGALQVYWALTLSDTKLSHVTVSLYGPAISNLSLKIAATSSGADEGAYEAHWNDLVPNVFGINLAGGVLLPVLLPVRVIGSILFAPTLFSEQHSVHGNYTR